MKEELELLRRRKAQANLVDYARYTYRRFRPADHHREIAEKLEAVERGELKRLMIFMPPRHGKSELASRRFPAWFTGRNPEREIIAASYNSDLAGDFGREVRNIVGSVPHRLLFPRGALAQDSKASDRWHTVSGGGYAAAGVGTAVTGRGAHVFLIDDPFKDREEADSERNRNRVYNWYLSTAYTRLEGDVSVSADDPDAWMWEEPEEAAETGEKFEGAIVLIQCMTGDTPVLMSDGVEKPLRDVRPGDQVATYEGGSVSTAKVMNWANQGPDHIFKIKMKSGIVVRANARHPFLVSNNGIEEWQRTDTLKKGDRILRVIGGSGKGLPAPLQVATSLQNVRACATLTTTRTDGRKAFGPLQSILSHVAKRICDTAMELALMTMTACWPNKAGCAPFAGPFPAICPNIGTRNSASITATQPARFERFSATTATTSFEKNTPLSDLNRPLNTCEITTDEIVEVVAAGVEDVFDIQVERTENFIANGLVSHNTRWHEDDLAGRLIRDQEKGADQWEVLSLPAIREEEGKTYALWPEKYPLARLQQTKATLTSREWNALYQQQPVPEDGTYFKREWFQRHETEKVGLCAYPKEQKTLSVVITSDFAVTDKDDADFTELAVWGLNADDGAFLLDWWSGQETAAVWIEAVITLMKKWRPGVFFGETGVIRRAVEPILRRRMRERKVFCRLEWLTRTGDKAAMARGFQGRAEMGLVSLPETDWSEDVMRQLLQFPAGLHDDKVDACALLGMALDKAHPAITYIAPAEREPDPDDYGVDLEEDNVIQWKTA